jgi:ribosomal protein L32
MAESARQHRPSKARRKRRRIGAFSKRLTFSDLDRRTNAGKYVNSIKNALEAQIGTPSPGQQILIKLVAVKMLRCEMMYDRVLSQPDGGDLQDRVENYLYEGLGVKQDAVLLCAAMTAAL